MKTLDLKKILEISFSIGKSFSPVTEYVYINKNIVKATNLESYLELTLNENLPFNGCVLKEPLQKFLNSIDKNTELNFEVNGNVLTILYGKKNKFNIPMESLNSFPETPSTKYTEDSLINSLIVTNDLIENFERAIKFVSDTETAFNGLFLKGNKIYSSNREIIYSGELEAEVDYSAFIPKDLIKYIIKFKETFEKIEIYNQGFRITGDKVVLYFPNLGDNKAPDFENVLNCYEKLFIIKNTEELKNCINRIKQFDEVVDISIKGNTVNIFTNNINEIVEFENSIVEEIDFKFNISYLKMIVDMSDYIDVLIREGSSQPKALGGGTDKYRIISAVIG